MVTEFFERNEWNQFIQDLERSRPDRAYQHHPARSQLVEYVSAVTVDTPEVETLAEAPDGDLHAWLEGASGWSASAVSLHVLTCSICRRRVELIRQEQLAPSNEVSASSWWQPILDAVSKALAAPGLRRVATGGAIGIVFLSLAFGLMPSSPTDSDNNPPVPVERHEPRGGGIG
ncbi:MAG: hypothetical protein ABEK03_04055 [Candidatus Bipolaricaulia bacterium]